MELSEMTDDQLLAEVPRAKQALAEAEDYYDRTLAEAAGRKTILNKDVAEAAGIAIRTLYVRLDRAWKRARS